MDDFINEDYALLDSDEESILDGMLAGDCESDSSDSINSSDEISSDADRPITPTRQPCKRVRKRAQHTAATRQAQRKSTWQGYKDKDDGMPSKKDIKFKPKEAPGIILKEIKTRGTVSKLSRAIDFFRLFFTVEVLGQICMFTNEYARQHIHEKPTYATAAGEWNQIGVQELDKLCGLLIYMGLVQFPDIDSLYCTSAPYHGSWARAFMPKDRLKGLLCFLRITDPNHEAPGDPLCKVRYLLDHMKKACKGLYKPRENISIDERMVKSKGRFSFIQYIRDKPTRWGFKLWVVADSSNAYTYDFDVYVGKRTVSSKHGLGYDVVMELCKNLEGQGYKLFVDNFYSSSQLFTDLKRKGIFACGTVMSKRKGFPKEFKDTSKTWDKESEKGEVRWVRDGETVVIQWKDNRVVSLMSTFHSGSDRITTERTSRVGGEHKKITIDQPKAIQDYNQYMGGVDRSDQLIGSYNILRKTNQFWKTLFFHFLDIAVVNSYILFCEMRALHSNRPEFQRLSRYGQRQFREELLMQLGGIDKGDPIPLYRHPKATSKCRAEPAAPRAGRSDDAPMHLPEVDDCRRTCKVCYMNGEKGGSNANKCRTKCMVCEVYLCTSSKNCFYYFHTDDRFEKYRK